jgi:hypothetical protein
MLPGGTKPPSLSLGMKGPSGLRQAFGMGYGNPLFDGDEPLPAANPRQRIVSMRVWLGGLVAGTLGEGTGLPDRHHDEDSRGRGAESQWRQEQGERGERDQ